jgi:predicted short-subunit dehydrogenase-like oxidoreductase (DUF2520 family)
VSRTLFILGAGRAGQGLARAFAASGLRVVGLHGRRAAPTGHVPITAGPLPPMLGAADTVLVTVRDSQLEGALATLTGAALAPGAVVLHASGSIDPAGLAPLRAAGHPAGTFHPLLPFADPVRSATRLRGAWIGVDGDARAVAAAHELADALGAHALIIPPGTKPRYHAAAVIASNFPTVLGAVAERLLRRSGIAADAARGAVLALMSSAVDNLAGAAAEDALSGPIARGDAATVRIHLDALAQDPAARDAYRVLSLEALALAREAHGDGDGLREIEALLAAGVTVARGAARRP